MKKLTTLQQIQVLKRSKYYLANESYGICNAIRQAAEELKHFKDYREYQETEVKNIIPILTMENAFIACKNHKMALPNLAATYKMYWWHIGQESDRPRYTFINWMIKELKKQL